MFKSFLLVMLMASFLLSASAKKKEQPPDPAWAGITARGRMLAEYDLATWHATDAVMALKPARGSTTYIAQKTGHCWVVVFGRMNAEQDKYLIVYQLGLSFLNISLTRTSGVHTTS